MFDKIIGYEKEKQELKILCDMAKNSENYRALGVRLPRGLLLYGVPGVGKTLMATALIEEMGRKTFMLRKDVADGEFIDKIGSVFAEAKSNAPSVVFLDDMDKFTSDDRSRNPEEFVAVQSGIDGVSDADVFIVATVNDYYILPKSLMRAGRFDRVMRIGVPDRSEAVEIVRHYLADKKVSAEISPEVIARILDGESCAKLESVLNEAGIYAAFEGKGEISREHIVNAILRSEIAADAPFGKTSDAAKYEIAFHEAGHAVAAYLFDKDSLGIISVSTPFNEVFGITQILQGKDYFYSYQLMEQRVIAILAGRAAVELKFGHVDVGAASDIERALHIVQRFVKEYAAQGLRYFSSDSKRCISSERKKCEMVQKADSVLEALYDSSKTLLQKNWNMVELLAEELYKRGTILYDEVEELFELNGVAKV